MKQRYIPKDSKKIKLDVASVVVYTFEKDSRPCAIAYGGKRSKPDWHISFASESSRQLKIDEYFKIQRERQDSINKEKAEKKLPTTLMEGDILICSWGYDQTNVDFYQVVKVNKSGKSVHLQQISSNVTSNGALSMSGVSVPNVDDFISEVFTKRVNSQNTIKISSYSFAHKWNGQPACTSWYA